MKKNRPYFASTDNNDKSFINLIHDRLFRIIHSNRLIYNTCWEDPHIDRQLLRLSPDSRVVMITSAGCNALDYLLDSPEIIHTVDMNPHQNALLQLKLSLIEQTHYHDFFKMFGEGHHESYNKDVYESIKESLPSGARLFWDKNIHYFNGANCRRKSFYYHATTGEIAWLFLNYLFHFKKGVRPKLMDLLDAKTLEEQRSVYSEIESEVWDSLSQWIVRRPVFMTMLGVPRPQIRIVSRNHPGGLSGFIQDKLRHVFAEIPIDNNYFWRVYITGAYTPHCCPNYLKSENFDLLRSNISRIHIHTCTLSELLIRCPGKYTHFILLDHQDWMAEHDPKSLNEEWELIIKNSAPGAKILMRSAATDLTFLPESVKSTVRFLPELTKPLHIRDRVGTYGSLNLAEIS